jgi:hypothetical protein
MKRTPANPTPVKPLQCERCRKLEALSHRHPLTDDQGCCVASPMTGLVAVCLARGEGEGRRRGSASWGVDEVSGGGGRGRRGSNVSGWLGVGCGGEGGCRGTSGRA